MGSRIVGELRASSDFEGELRGNSGNEATDAQARQRPLQFLYIEEWRRPRGREAEESKDVEGFLFSVKE
jgi:hypothetical protein